MFEKNTHRCGRFYSGRISSGCDDKIPAVETGFDGIDTVEQNKIRTFRYDRHAEGTDSRICCCLFAIHDRNFHAVSRGSKEMARYFKRGLQRIGLLMIITWYRCRSGNCSRHFRKHCKCQRHERNTITKMVHGASFLKNKSVITIDSLEAAYTSHLM